MRPHCLHVRRQWLHVLRHSLHQLQQLLVECQCARLVAMRLVMMLIVLQTHPQQRRLKTRQVR